MSLRFLKLDSFAGFLTPGLVHNVAIWIPPALVHLGESLDRKLIAARRATGSRARFLGAGISAPPDLLAVVAPSPDGEDNCPRIDRPASEPKEMPNAYSPCPRDHPGRSNRGAISLDASQTGSAFTMFELRVPVAARVPIPHSHEFFDETLFGLEGVTTWAVSGELVTVGPGESVIHSARRGPRVRKPRNGSCSRSECHHARAARP